VIPWDGIRLIEQLERRRLKLDRLRRKHHGFGVAGDRPGPERRILHVAELIPRGYWTAYGEVGLAATGSARSARAVARCASRTRGFPNAWRVIHADGSIPEGWGRRDGGPARCRRLLEAEGVRFIDGRADPTKKILADELELLLAGEA
jgi:alkylated DNA nucleotide flippase Atl1